VFEGEIAVLLRDRDPEPGVVHHSENTPVHVARLKVHTLVHCADKNILRFGELGHGNVNIPEAPAETALTPLHIESAVVELLRTCFSVTVFGVVDVGQSPAPALVDRDFYSSDSPSATAIGISPDVVIGRC
jgi:hypothetical protein